MQVVSCSQVCWCFVINPTTAHASTWTHVIRSTFRFASWNKTNATVPAFCRSLLTTSSSNLSSVEDICKPEYLPPTAYYWINSFCYLQRIFRAFQWYHMWRGRALVLFSSSYREMASVSASTFYGKRKSKCIILFIEQILAWNVVGLLYMSLLTTHWNIVWIILSTVLKCLKNVLRIGHL